MHLLYARFWHKVLFDRGVVSTNEPFQRLFNQGMVQAFAFKDQRGALVPVDEVDERTEGAYVKRATGEPVERLVAKMSKSLRNVESLDKIIGEFGADTFRMYLMFMGPLDSSRPWDTKAIAGVHRFLKRAWKFVTGERDAGVRECIAESAESTSVRRAINLAVKRVTADIEALQFNTAVSSLMECLNAIGDEPVSKETLRRFVLILSPMAPHIAEELWERLGNTASSAYETWPSYDEDALKQDTVAVVVQVMGKKRAVIEVAPTISEQLLKEAVCHALQGTEYKATLDDKFITVFQSGSAVPRLVNVVKAGKG